MMLLKRFLNMLNWLKKSIESKILYIKSHIYTDDPVYNCQLYRDLSCSHVDGILCDFPFCKMSQEYGLYLGLKEYMKNLEAGLAVKNEGQIAQYYELKKKYEHEKQNN